jgi:AcrR family transcriptional regulator
VQLELVRGAGAGVGPPRPSSASQRVRLVDAALWCVARQGIAKTTLEDVARAAGCSRATVYRAFPGGKEGLLAAVVDTEVARFFTALAVDMAAAEDLETVLVAGMTGAAVAITEHPALAFVVEREPELLLPHLAFGHLDNVLDVSSTFTAPFLGRWLDHEEARRVAQWAARIVLSYLSCPVDGVDLTEETVVRHLVRTFMLPGKRADKGGGRSVDRSLNLIPTTKGEAS